MILFFSIQKVEKMEREDAEACIVAKPKKGSLFGGKGRTKTVKKELTETKPSPHGIRVVPKIDKGIMAKIAAADKKSKRVKNNHIYGFYKTVVLTLCTLLIFLILNSIFLLTEKRGSQHQEDRFLSW